ncbi:hypothetical protein [Thermococcus piezophilus]|uniref:Uncharacterized protein n=1 Tax=Thermococcus piezophilus TaxID=1712654 RepID=A0A172WH19_9EURY|nr:hypothetical protein [Thermococcus piezophilus]ANF22615.1 hypothetical protein A7C91_05100 [Thermococcus piezophilus]
MGLIKKLVIGFFVLLFLGIAGAFGIYYYVLSHYDQELIVSSNAAITGPVYYTSEVFQAGKYRIVAESDVVVEKIQTLDPNTGDAITEYEGDDVIYGSSNSFQVRINYNGPNPNAEYSVSVKIYRSVERD